MSAVSGSSPGGALRTHGPDLAAFAAGAGLFEYVFLRALKMPITIDEALTFLAHLRASWPAMLSPAHMRVGMPANHLLNSVLARVSASLFGPPELALRLPNVLAFALYLVFGWRTLRRLASPALALAAFPLLFANPYVLDFFSLCRGYGLSLAFLALGVWLGLEALEDRPGGAAKSAGALGALALASLASFPLVAPLAVAAAGIIAIRGRRAARRREPLVSIAMREVLPGALIGAATAAIVLAHLRRMANLDLLYFGGTRGFVADTVGTLVRKSFYGSAREGALAPWAIGAVVALFWMVNGLAVWRRRSASLAFLACLLLLDGSVVESIAAHAFLGSRFVVSRVAIFFVPLFVFAVVGAAGVLDKEELPAVRRTPTVLAILVAAAAGWHFARGANLRWPLDWRADATTPAMLADLARERAGPAPFLLAAAPQRGAAIEFYRVIEGARWFRGAERLKGEWTTPADFVYLSPVLLARAEALGFRIVRVYPATGNVLAARR